MPPRRADPATPSRPPSGARPSPDELLERYRAKRSTDTTPEPFDGGEAARPGLFVVHKHAARRLHYDLRLELNGVLRSWAVPKGPSLDPAEKRYAAEVEDHPLNYADFEGVIPKGNYGAGPSIVWDKGQWIPENDVDEGYREGKLTFTLKGYKLKGLWELIRLKTAKDWLLFKKKDAYAKPGESGFPEESILSGLTVEELGAGADRAAALVDEARRLGAKSSTVDPRKVELALAETRDEPFSEAGWLFEPKVDGYRALVGRAGGKAFLIYRGGGDAVDTYPELATALGALPVEHVILDGEVACLDAAGRASFQRLQRRGMIQRAPERMRASVENPATLFVFDLLAFADLDLRPLPLSARKGLLAKLLPGVGPIRVVTGIEEHGAALYGEATRLGFEGMVAKRLDAPYPRGRSKLWIKVRALRSDDFVVVGYSPPRDSRVGIGALHVAWYDAGELVYAGRVGTGFSDKQLRELRETLDADRVKEPPCEGPVPKGKEQVWSRPRLVCEVRYKEWTEDHLLRQPVFLRFRDDKRPEECVRPGESVPAEEAVAAPPPRPAARGAGAKTRGARPAPDPIDDRVVAISRPEKVFWPKEGYTKGDLIRYYETISPWLLPYLKDRPLVLTRYPDGIEGKSFYQKDAPVFAPSWLRRIKIYSEGSDKEIEYFVADDVESLVYIVNLGAILLHVWSSRVGSLQNPDWCILDLDPKTAPFRDVVTIAIALHELCDEIGLPVYVKTSGSTGLHLLVPLAKRLTYEECRTLAMLLAQVVLAKRHDIGTVIRNPSARGGKVYIDTLQNRHGQLLVAPFSVRPLPAAPVSTPLEWSEVNQKLDMKAFTMETVPKRMARKKRDPFLPVLSTVPDLHGALERLAGMMAKTRPG